MNAVLQISAAELSEMTQMRPFPDTAQRLLTASRSESSTMIELTEIITQDPVLSMQLLKIANSSTYGMTAQISSIQHAGVIIGLTALKNLAVSILVGDMFESGDAKTVDARQRLFDHSLQTACIAKHISAVMPQGNPDEAFLGGMLHDIGKLLMVDHRPSEYPDALRLATSGESVESESQLFGIDHVSVGEACCEAWGLPGSMIDFVADHHASDTTILSADLQAVVVGNWLSGAWNQLTQEDVDAALQACSECESGAVCFETLHAAVQEEIDVMMKIRASR